MAKSNQSAGRRLSTFTLDQLISSASNVLAAILAARALGVAVFGLFGIVLIIYVTAQGAARALVCEPLLIHPVEAKERPGDAIGTGAVLGLGIGSVVVLGGLGATFWFADLGAALLVLGFCLPLLVLQDLGRYIGFATHRPFFSVVLDLLWLLLMFLAVAVLFLTDHKTLTWFVLAWAGSGAAAGLVVVARFAGQRLRLSLSWLRETWQYSSRYLLAYLATQGATLIASIGFGAIAGPASLGAIRGAQLLQGPVVAFLIASIASGVTEISRLTPGRAAVRAQVRRTTSLTLLVAAMNMTVLLLLPDQLGVQVLGASWEPAQRLLLPASVQMVLLATIAGPRAAMVGLRQIRTTMRIDVTTVVILLVLPLIGVALNGALGAYWFFAVAQGIVAVVWWVVFLRHDLAKAPDVRTAEPAEPARVVLDLPPA